MLSDKRSTDSAEIYKIASDVLVMRFKTDRLVVLADVKELDTILCEVANGEDVFVIVDALGIQSNMNTEAQKYFSRESTISKSTIATAVLLDNLPIRLTASVFIKFHKPVFPTKMFSKKGSALSWFDKIRIQRL
ncbi:MAG: hypothetical protein BM555_03275 [Crocinitomix sp. MedPE-SWsnd]|jgi:proline racemase|nr:MAG: hypothetical protein BM555_03275 [Crocinitomix sp. MedPE-SWsnd]